MPVACCPDDLRKPFLERCRELRLDTGGLKRSPHPVNLIRLDCHRDEHKPEVAELNQEPLAAEDLKAALECDPVLLNCTSGRDTCLDAWTAFRSHWRKRHPRGWLQMDWHSLSLDWEPGRVRRLRRVADADSWLAGLDLLQCTLAETESIDGLRRHSLAECATLWPIVSAAGCKRLVVTDGAAGIACLDETGPRLYPAAKAGRVRDTTGCGDVLGAGLLGMALPGARTDEVIARALAAAARILEGRGLQRLDALKDLNRNLERNAHCK